MKKYFFIIPLFIIALAFGCAQKEAEKKDNGTAGGGTQGGGNQEKPVDPTKMNLGLKIRIIKVASENKIYTNVDISDNKPDFKDVSALEGMKLSLVSKGKDVFSTDLKFKEEYASYFAGIESKSKGQSRMIKDLPVDELKFTALDVEKPLTIELDKDFTLMDKDGKILEGKLSWDKNSLPEEIALSKLENLSDAEMQYFNIYEIDSEDKIVEPVIAKQKGFKIAQGKARIDLKDFSERIKNVQDGNKLIFEVRANWIKTTQWELRDDVVIVNPIVEICDRIFIEFN